MMKMWDGRPVNFVCCARKQPSEAGNGPPLGEIFWCVTIEVLQDGDDVEEDEENGEDNNALSGGAANDVD